jgi:hypothetical protein
MKTWPMACAEAGAGTTANHAARAAVATPVRANQGQARRQTAISEPSIGG